MEEVTFFSDGVKVAGSLYLPAHDRNPAAPWPAVVIAMGWLGRRFSPIEGRALELVNSGFAVLTFDYRGYGASDGPPNRLFPQELTTDIRAGVAFLRGRKEIDRARVAVLGPLTGAAACLQAASEDPAIAAVVAFFPFGDGRRWMRSTRKHWEWRAFLDRVDRDRVARSAGGDVEMVDPDEIRIMAPADTREHHKQINSAAEGPSMSRREWKLGLDSADAIMSFRPEDHFHRIAPRPVMVVAIEDDLMLPIEEARLVFDKLGTPKRWLLRSGIAHADIGGKAQNNDVMAQVATFLTEAMPATTA